MKIAVTYENGSVFQHFGHTEQFKLYEVEDGQIRSTRLVDSKGSGHGALAGVLKQQGVDLLICGGIGPGAQNALAEQGIALCAGASGSADEAVAAFLRGELVDSGANCDHHSHAHGEQGCGAQDCGSHGCGEQGGCGGCHGGLQGKNLGKTCRVHYRGTFNDGVQFDSSYERGEPLEFVCGAGQMIPGFDAAVADLEPGEERDVHLTPEEAYGPADPEAIFTVQIAELSGAEEVGVGERVYLQGPDGRPIPVRVVAKDERSITFDANHEMAGKELNFHIELVERPD